MDKNKICLSDESNELLKDIKSIVQDEINVIIDGLDDMINKLKSDIDYYYKESVMNTSINILESFVVHAYHNKSNTYVTPVILESIGVYDMDEFIDDVVDRLEDMIIDNDYDNLLGHYEVVPVRYISDDCVARYRIIFVCDDE